MYTFKIDKTKTSPEAFTRAFHQMHYLVCLASANEYALQKQLSASHAPFLNYSGPSSHGEPVLARHGTEDSDATVDFFSISFLTGLSRVVIQPDDFAEAGDELRYDFAADTPTPPSVLAAIYCIFQFHLKEAITLSDTYFNDPDMALGKILANAVTPEIVITAADEGKLDPEKLSEIQTILAQAQETLTSAPAAGAGAPETFVLYNAATGRTPTIPPLPLASVSSTTDGAPTGPR